jgi:acid phosphatase type 7
MLTTRAIPAATAVALLAAACGGDTPPAPSGGGGEAIQVFEPAGCKFSIASRPEYTDVHIGKTDVGAVPNIRRVRLGLGGNVAHGVAGRADPSTSIGFGWQTDDGTLATEVAWGASPDPATWPAANRTTGITWLTPPGTFNPQGTARMHEAYVCGLSPNTTYYYRVGGGPVGGEAWSDVYSFKTTPSDPDTEVTIGVSGDSRGQENDAWRLIQRRVLAAAADLQIFSGDVVILAPDQREWEQWLDAAWKDTDGSLLTLGQVLTLPAHGNHENHSSLFFGNIVMPQDVQNFPRYGELFFSMDVGPVHLVVLDDGWIVNPIGDDQFAAALTPWLREDLDAANKNRAAVPWIVTVHHHSPYSSSEHGKDRDVLLGRSYFGPLYDEFHVDLVLAGHDHNYERSKPLTTNPDNLPTVQTSFDKGTVYVVCAGSGADPYPSGVSDFTEISRDYKTGGALGFYGMLKAKKTSLVFDAHELRLDATDPVVDTLTIGR